MRAFKFINGVLLIDWYEVDFIERQNLNKCDFNFELKPTGDNSFREWVGDDKFKGLAVNIMLALMGGRALSVGELLLYGISVTNHGKIKNM